jgi:hypothetical protein
MTYLENLSNITYKSIIFFSARKISACVNAIIAHQNKKLKEKKNTSIAKRQRDYRINS